MATKKTTTSKVVKKEDTKMKTCTKDSCNMGDQVKPAVKGKKQAAKPTASKKKEPVLKTKSQTVVVAKVDIGFGNALYIRGQGAGLSWEKGIPMENIGADEWRWVTDKASPDGIAFKLLINDSTWALGNDYSVMVGSTSITRPEF